MTRPRRRRSPGRRRGSASEWEEAATDSPRHNCSARYCCGKCTVGLWRSILAGGLDRQDLRLRLGLSKLRSMRDGQGGWRAFPFWYTVLALTEMDRAEARGELRVRLRAHPGRRQSGPLARARVPGTPQCALCNSRFSRTFMATIEHVSGTAFVVAEFRAEENAEPAPLYRDPIVELFLNEDSKRAARRVAEDFPLAKDLVKIRTKCTSTTRWRSSCSRTCVRS